MGYRDTEERVRTPLEERERIERVIATGRVLQEVWGERDRQDAKWGQQNWPVGNTPSENRILAEGMAKHSCDSKLADKTATWVDILNEEFTEFAAAVDEDEARTELLQVAAVAVAAVERIDRLRRDRVQADLNSARETINGYRDLLGKRPPLPHAAHDIQRDTIGACSPTNPCPACQVRLAAKKEY